MLTWERREGTFEEEKKEGEMGQRRVLYPSFHFSFISNLYLIGLQVVQDPVKVRRIALPAVARHLVAMPGDDLDLDRPSFCGHTALCTAAMEGDLESLNVEGGNEMKGTNE